MVDYIIVGGGLAGCVLASRLKEYDTSLRVAIIEAGPNEHDHPLITEPMGTMQLHNSPFEYNMKTIPQRHCDDREIFQAGGRLLSGSSSVNYAAWTRGDRADYDMWGKMVKDHRWCYDGLLPFFRRTETHHDDKADPHQHGFDGPIHSAPALGRTYPLTEHLRAAYIKIGVKPIHDHNGGDNKGMAPHVDNWYNGKRQPAGKAYNLGDVKVITNTVVKRVILEESRDGLRKATGVELVSGQILGASKEVVVSCGALRSPQLLMLSGIGPAEELRRHDIPLLIESPGVGQNLCDHCAVTQFYRIRNPERGLCAPSSAFNHPSYLKGLPTDYIIAESAPSCLLKEALQYDHPNEAIADTHPSLSPPRSHYEFLPMYAPAEVPFTNMNIPLDGSIVSIGILNLLPTSRGHINLASANPLEDPLIDPNYCATVFDRTVLRAAMRRNMSAFETPEAQGVVMEEVPPAGYPALTSQSTDADLDVRVRRTAASFYHAGGTLSMGQVVDTECRVFGAQGLRVVDASVIPTPISAHYMVAIYALAEQMADIIAEKQERP